MRNSEKKDILLTTLNARYSHTALGLRYLLANLGDLSKRALLLEFECKRPIQEIADEVLSHEPKIVGLGVYIWNVTKTLELIHILKKRNPKLYIILGGPEAGYAPSDHSLLIKADFCISGEADIAFRELCEGVLSGDLPTGKRIIPPPPNPDLLQLPYDLYSDHDIAHRIIYVETTRGCPFQCEYCISSREESLRLFSLERVFEGFQNLLDRGARHFKFIDRTFNVDAKHCLNVLQFFKERYTSGLFLHLEMKPDLFSAELKSLLCTFPPMSLQFELGIQTFDMEVANRIKRYQDYDLIERNLQFLRNETQVYLHTDLIAGLPGESMESFVSGFDRLIALKPHEIQLGILKRLHGAPISKYDREFKMRYNPAPPYNILETGLISTAKIKCIDRFAHYWDTIYNSGNFIESAPLIWKNEPSTFHAFLQWSEWFYDHTHKEHGIPLNDTLRYLFSFLTDYKQQDRETVAKTLLTDYMRAGRRDVPICLRPHVGKWRPTFKTIDGPVYLKRQWLRYTYQEAM